MNLVADTAAGRNPAIWRGKFRFRRRKALPKIGA